MEKPCCHPTPATQGRNYTVKAHYQRNRAGFKVTWVTTRCMKFCTTRAEVLAWVKAHEEMAGLSSGDGDT